MKKDGGGGAAHGKAIAIPEFGSHWVERDEVGGDVDQVTRLQVALGIGQVVPQGVVLGFGGKGGHAGAEEGQAG